MSRKFPVGAAAAAEAAGKSQRDAGPASEGAQQAVERMRAGGVLGWRFLWSNVDRCQLCERLLVGDMLGVDLGVAGLEIAMRVARRRPAGYPSGAAAAAIWSRRLATAGIDRTPRRRRAAASSTRVRTARQRGYS